jgi:mobilome CxxCx(11)CxxC protein
MTDGKFTNHEGSLYFYLRLLLMTTSAAKTDMLRQDCWRYAMQAFGTAYIFQQRAHKVRKLLRITTFLGIAIPVIIGGIITSFSAMSGYLPYFITLAGILGIVQLVMSIWSLVAGWDNELAYALESLADNYHLSSEFEQLAKSPPPDLELRFEVIRKQNQFREDADNKQDISDKEKRKGMRAALRQFQRPCLYCHEVPSSMIPSDCEVCGRF